MTQTKRLSCLTNEVVIFVKEKDFSPRLVKALVTGGTKQIEVDRARSFRTPFGSYMIIATLTVTRHGAETRDLREYVARRLTREGLPLALTDVLAPARAHSVPVEQSDDEQ